MSFKPIDQILERVDNAREDSDVSLSMSLLYLGELVVKLITVSTIAAISDDRDRNRYRVLYNLVRGNGLGDWSQALDDALIGPASQYLLSEARIEQRELTQKCPSGSWQYEAVQLLRNCLIELNIESEELPIKIDLRQWFILFTILRNQTRGHGAPSSEHCGSICTPLEKSIQLIVKNFKLFKRPCAYLHRNLSGKYNVIPISENITQFSKFKSSQAENVPNGLYIYFDVPVKIDLIESSAGAYDFYFANGLFTDTKFEMRSYLTNDRVDGDSRCFLASPGTLPPSATEGLGKLDVIGKCFSNIPAPQEGIIRRKEIEDQLTKVILDNRHPIVSLVGRGGIGKTSLALSVLSDLCNHEDFKVIFWFSARDIDLLPEGPKMVRPHVLDRKDIAKFFVELIEPHERYEKGFNAQSFFEKYLTSSSIGPVLFIFDNFETVKDPQDLFNWLDSYIRLPNKILITTRFREFKGDYDIGVEGMTEAEYEQLINITAEKLDIKNLLTRVYIDNLYIESEGHPYVIKILLGEVAKAGHLTNVKRIIADQEKILTALFERTYVSLSPCAKRVFLTLSNWHSAIPQVALEAVLLRPANEKMDVRASLDELARASMIEITKSQADGELFISVPLVAMVFGEQKLKVSPLKTAVEADTALLQLIGASQRCDIKNGIGPKVERIFFNVARMREEGRKINDYLPILESIASSYSEGWRLIAALYEEDGSVESIEKAKEALRRYLEVGLKKESISFAWKKLSELCQKTNDYLGEIHALIEMSERSNVPFYLISNATHKINTLLYEDYVVLDAIEKEILLKRLAKVMGDRISEGDVSDYAKLSRLYEHIKDKQSAKYFIKKGLEKDPENVYCRKFAKKIGIMRECSHCSHDLDLDQPLEYLDSKLTIIKCPNCGKGIK